MPTDFARNLTEQRHRSKLSQKAAAEALEVSQGLLSHYENGIREPGLDFLVRAAKFYGVTTDDLLGCGRPGPIPAMEEEAFSVPFVEQMHYELHNAFVVLLDLLNEDYDPTVATYIRTYLGETMYEMFRLLYRANPGYDPNLFTITDQQFDSGAVVSDLTMVRAQYIQALDRMAANRTKEPEVLTPERLPERFAPYWPSVLNLLRMSSTRLHRQFQAEQNCRIDFPTHSKSGGTP